MATYYWNDWYTGWGWFLWIGVWFLLISSFGNWGYTYRVHQKYSDRPQKDAFAILNERYARGEIKHDEYLQMKANILSDARESLAGNSERPRMNNSSPLKTSSHPAT